QRGAVASHGLEGKLTNVLAIPTLAGVASSVESHVGGDEEGRIVDAVESEIARSGEGKFLRFPGLALVGGEDQIAFENRPHLIAVSGNFHGLRELVDERILAVDFPGGAVIGRSEQAAGGRGVPGVVAESHVVDEERGKRGNRLLGHRGGSSSALLAL